MRSRQAFKVTMFFAAAGLVFAVVAPQIDFRTVLCPPKVAQYRKEFPSRGQRKAPALVPADILERFSFSAPDSLKAWEEKIFREGTLSQVLSENGQGFLKIETRNACSGFYRKVDYEVKRDLLLAWKWRAVGFPQRKNPDGLPDKKEDDFSARVYAIFPAANFFKTDVIEYIWDGTLAAGTVGNSAYSARVKMCVIESGPGGTEDGGWRTEERNVYEDYRKLFGREPKHHLGIVALMSDSDNTQTSSEADFGEVRLERKRVAPANGAVSPEGGTTIAS